MKFKTSKKVDEWIKDHKHHCEFPTAAGEQFKYEFIPSGLVEIQTVTCMGCKAEFTDYV